MTTKHAALAATLAAAREALDAAHVTYLAHATLAEAAELNV